MKKSNIKTEMTTLKIINVVKDYENLLLPEFIKKYPDFENIAKHNIVNNPYALYS